MDAKRIRKSEEEKIINKNEGLFELNQWPTPLKYIHPTATV